MGSLSTTGVEGLSSLQRSNMSIAAQYVQAPRSSGAQCGINGGTQEAMLLAPEGRHVYSSAIHPSPALQRSAMWYR